MLILRIFNRIIFFLILLPTLACAETVKLEDMIINSDHLKINQTTMEATFNGSVVLWFNNGIIIETDKLIITATETNNKRRPEKITIPYKFRAIQNKKNNNIAIIGDKAEYIFKTEELKLSGNINIQSEENFIKCEELVYLTNLKNITTKDK